MLTFEIIYEAVNGDIESLNTIMEQYLPYINTLARRKINYEDRTDYIVDIDLRDQLISKMIDLILNFTPVPNYKSEE
jgi:hypothetical protein